jgi:DNA modification methylase
VVKIAAPRLIEVTKVKVHPNNVKEHPEKQINNLIQLIKWVGFKDPIVLDKDFNCKAGHGRLLAAQKLGMKEIPYVSLEGLTKKQMDLFIYMDNQINESPWIKENVELLLEEIPMQDLELFEVDWEGVRKPVYPEENKPIPELPIVPKTKPGDVYQLENHRIMCGDCTKDLDKLMNGQEMKLTLTDPPYNIGFTYNRHNDKQTQQQYSELMRGFFDQVSKHNLILTCGLQNLGLWYDIKQPSDVGIWYKKNSRSGASAFHFRRCEPILFYGKFKKRTDDYFDYSREDSKELEEVENEKGVGRKYDRYSPAKPMKFWIELLLSYSKPDEIVLDTFMGTGTTLISCENTGRICYGMELDPAYVDVIVQRWENFTGKQAKLI